MTVEECTALLGPFALALNKPMDVPTFRAYHKVLADVPAGLLAAAIAVEEQRADLEFMPSAPRWRGLCELQRRALLALHPFDGCIDCEDAKGWRPVLVDGVARVERCGCVERHQAKLAALGLTGQPLSVIREALPAPDGESTRAGFDDLPADVRTRLGAVASSHSLRRVK